MYIVKQSAGKWYRTHSHKQSGQKKCLTQLDKSKRSWNIGHFCQEEMCCIYNVLSTPGKDNQKNCGYISYVHWKLMGKNLTYFKILLCYPMNTSRSGVCDGGIAANIVRKSWEWSDSNSVLLTGSEFKAVFGFTDGNGERRQIYSTHWNIVHEICDISRNKSRHLPLDAWRWEDFGMSKC